MNIRHVVTIAVLAMSGFSTGAAVSAGQTAGLLIEDVTLIDGTGRPAVTHAWVLVTGDRIQQVSGQPIDVSGVRRIDGRGRWLIPGLMDVHIHLDGGRGRGGGDERAAVEALHGFLYSGFTSVFDAGNSPDFIFDLRRRERAGELVAPRIFATGGVVTVPGGHGAGRGPRW